MGYKTFSDHAPTGVPDKAKFVVSPNPYAPEGREIGWPSNYSLYVTKIDDIDGSQQVIEEHSDTQLVGNRLYLYHRPMVDSAGNVLPITVSDPNAVMVSGNTNAKQGYIEFSTNPTGNFTVSYTAAPDCDDNLWNLNNLQNDVMEIETFLWADQDDQGVGLRNLQVGINDKPSDPISKIMPKSFSFGHLGTGIVGTTFRISSTDDTSLSGTLGDAINIQIGRAKDSVLLEGTGITLTSTVGTTPSLNLKLGTETGDTIYFEGILSGRSQVTFGGPNPGAGNYSGLTFSSGLTQQYYDDAMLRVNGDIASMGDIKAIGTITVVNLTGNASTIIGDFIIKDELFVHGISHLLGKVEANDVLVKKDLTEEANIIFTNVRGNGADGHSTVDGLDPSEVAKTYRPVTAKLYSKGVIKGKRKKTMHFPSNQVFTPMFEVSGETVVGDVYMLSGRINAAAGPSGAYPSIVQLLFEEADSKIWKGLFPGTTAGVTDGGMFSRGLIDPGSFEIEIVGGAASGYRAPVYGWTVEQITNNSLTRLNVFTPELPSPNVSPNDPFVMYTPGCEPYEFIIKGTTDLDIKVDASPTEPLWVAYDDEVRVLDQATSDINIKSELENAISGMGDPNVAPRTGKVYILAKKSSSDVETAPNIIVRASPLAMPDEVAIGEVTAYKSGTSWTVLERVSYRPGGKYDSGWIPVTRDYSALSGRITPRVQNEPVRMWFKHNLGSDMNFYDVSTKLYLGEYDDNYLSGNIPNQYNMYQRSLWGGDVRSNYGNSGAFTVVPLDNKGPNDREASVFYVDSSIIGIQIEPEMFDATVSGSKPMKYLRLVMTRDS